MAEYEGNLPIINDDTYSHMDKVEDIMMMSFSSISFFVIWLWYVRSKA